MGPKLYKKTIQTKEMLGYSGKFTGPDFIKCRLSFLWKKPIKCITMMDQAWHSSHTHTHQLDWQHQYMSISLNIVSLAEYMTVLHTWVCVWRVLGMAHVGQGVPSCVHGHLALQLNMCRATPCQTHGNNVTVSQCLTGLHLRGNIRWWDNTITGYPSTYLDHMQNGFSIQCLKP